MILIENTLAFARLWRDAYSEYIEYDADSGNTLSEAIFEEIKALGFEMDSLQNIK